MGQKTINEEIVDFILYFMTFVLFKGQLYDIKCIIFMLFITVLFSTIVTHLPLSNLSPFHSPKRRCTTDRRKLPPSLALKCGTNLSGHRDQSMRRTA